MLTGRAPSARLSVSGARCDGRASTPAATTAGDHVLAEWPGEGPRRSCCSGTSTRSGRSASWRGCRSARKDGGPVRSGRLRHEGGLAIGMLAVRVLLDEQCAAASRPRRHCCSRRPTKRSAAAARRGDDRAAGAQRRGRARARAVAAGRRRQDRAQGRRRIRGRARTASRRTPASIPARARARSTSWRGRFWRIERLSDPARGTHGQRRRHRRWHAAQRRRRARARDGRRAHRAPGGRGRVEAAFGGLRGDQSARALEVRGGINRPPMERTAGVARLYELARDVAREMGGELAEGRHGRRFGRELYGGAWRPNS